MKIILPLKARKKIALSLGLILNSCGPSQFVSSPSPNRLSKNNDAFARDISARHQSALEVIQNLYHMQKPVIGLGQFGQNTIPVISPVSVDNPDIVFQIYRCESATLIQGLFETYDPASSSLDSPDSAKIYFNKNQFWSDIQKRCSPLGVSHPQNEILDISAPSGHWKWVLRACMPRQETNDFLCSNVFTESFPLHDYKNSLSEQHQRLLKNISQKIHLSNIISSGFPGRARELYATLDECSANAWKSAERQIMRSILINLVGLGTSIIFKIFGPEASNFPTWTDKMRIIWQPDEDVQKNGQYITRVLLWLFTQEHDFKFTCSRAEEIRIDAAANVLKLQQLQFELANLLDEAARSGLTVPSEVAK